MRRLFRTVPQTCVSLWMARQGQKPPVVPKVNKATWGTFWQIVRINKKSLAWVILLTWGHAAMLMGLPALMKELHRLSNLRVGEVKLEGFSQPPSTDAGQGATQRTTSQPSEGGSTPTTPSVEIPGLGGKFDKLTYEHARSLLLGPRSNPSGPYSKDEIRSRYNEFAGFLFLFFASMAMAGYAKSVNSKRLEDMFAILLRKKIYKELMGKNYEMFMSKTHNPAQIAQKLNGNINNFTNGLVDNMSWFLRSCMFTVAGSTILLFNLPTFTIMTGGLMLVLASGSKIFHGRILEANKEQAQASNELSKYIGDQLTNFPQVKILGMIDRSSYELDKRLLGLHKKITWSAKIWSANMGLLESCGMGGLFLIICEGCFQISTGQMPAEMIWTVLNALFVAMGVRGIIFNISQVKAKLGILEDTLELTEDLQNFSYFKGDIRQLAEKTAEIKCIEALEELVRVECKSGSLKQLYDKLKQDPEVLKAVGILDSEQKIENFDVVFENVSFRYSADSDYVFHNLSCSFKSGKCHGILSASGLGKTTFLNLAIGLLKPTSGRVLVGGNDINSQDFDWGKMMQHCAYITQNTHLLMENILTNIALGNLSVLARLQTLEGELNWPAGTATKAAALKLLDAVKNAQAFEFVETQEDKLLTLIGDRGQGLSGGQLQRIVLARTFFRAPSLIMMDEATSALDKQSESQVVSYLSKFLQNKTSFVITHNYKAYQPLLQETHSLAELIHKSNSQAN